MSFNLNKSSMASSLVKVVFVVTTLTTGGAEMMLYKFLTRIDRDKFAPTVISLIPGGVFVDRLTSLDIPVYQLEMQPGKPSIAGIQQLTKLINQIQPDLIQGWMYHSNLAAQLANFLAKRKVPVLWSIHHSIASLRAEKKSLAVIIKLTAALSSQVKTVVFSSAKGQAQHEALGYCARNAMTIGDNFDLSKYKPATEPQFNLRQSLNLAKDSILIGSIARYHLMKDHANFLNAAAKIIPDYPDVHFILVGPEVDYQNSVLSAQIQRLGISKQVHLLGERQDIPELMTSLDIFTSSSAYGESFPNVLGEAMSCQIPCVTTDVGDSATIVGDTGVVVPIQDAQTLAAAWQKLIALGEKERRNLGEQARERIKQRFDLDAPNSFVRQYEDAYQKALLSTKG
jgi:glycosyltransferase involved in cell wall biosynthesis